MGTYAHVCLLLCSAVIALTTHAAEGNPVSTRIMPSPHWKRRSTSLLYPHRKLSRPWLIKMQEELWKEGPSGDGPDEELRSSMISSVRSRLDHVSESAYKTRSAVPGDFASSEEEPFPTIIDTAVDESPNLEGELVSRTSMPYEGPSSLLNSFIFRPSLPHLSPSIETSFLEDTWIASQNVIPTWLHGSSSWKMSTRQAISDSERLAIVTAISATHIYKENEWTLTENSIPSRHPSEIYASYMPTTTEERLLSTKTANHIEELPSTSSTAFQILSSPSGENKFYTSSDTFLSSSYQLESYTTKEFYHSSLELLMSNIPASPTENYFYSDALSRTMPYILTPSDSKSFDETKLLDLTPSIITSDPINSSLGLNSEQSYWGYQITSNTDTINTQILYDFDVSFYTSTPFQSFISSNIQTTVTIIDNTNDSDRFVMPTLTIHGTSPIIDTHFISFPGSMHSTLKVLEKTKIQEISSSFTDFNYIIPVISLWPLDDVTSVENIISHEDTKTVITENYSENTIPSQHESMQVSTMDPSLSTILSSIYSPLSENELVNDRSMVLPELKSQTSGLDIDKEYSILSSQSSKQNNVSSIEHTLPFSVPQNFASIPSERDYSANEIETYISKVNSEDWNSKYSNIPNNVTNLQSNISFGENIFYTALTESIFPTSNVLTMENLSPQLISPTRALTISRKSQQEMTSPIASVVPEIISANEEATSNEREILPTYHGSATENIDPSTHHVTVRSLSDSSVIDNGDSLLLSYATLTDSKVENLLTYTQSALIESLVLQENISSDEMFSPSTEINNGHYTYLTSYASYEDTHSAYISGISYGDIDSRDMHDLQSSLLSLEESKELDAMHTSLLKDTYKSTLSLFPVYSSDHSIILSSFTFPTIPEDENTSKDIHITELLTHTLIPSYSSPTVIFSTLSEERLINSYFRNTQSFYPPVAQSTVKSSNSSKLQEIISPHTFNNQTLSPDELSSKYFEGKPMFSDDTHISPSRTLTELGNTGELEISTDTLTENTVTSSTAGLINQYLETSTNFDKAEIISSMKYPYFSDISESKETNFRDIFTGKSLLPEITPSRTHFLETKYLYETISTPKFTPDSNEDPLYSYSSLSTNYDITSDEMPLNSYIFTPPLPIETSKGTLDYSISSKIFGSSNYREPPSGENHVIDDYSDFPLDNGSEVTSKYFLSEIVSIAISNFSYQTSNDATEDPLYDSSQYLPNSEIISFYDFDGSITSNINPAVSSLFTTNFISEINSVHFSPTIFIGSKTVYPLSSPTFEDVLRTEIYSRDLESSVDYLPHFTLPEESHFFHTPEMTPYPPMVTHKESSCLISSCHIHSEHAKYTPSMTPPEESSLFPENESISLVDPVLTGDHKVFNNSSSITKSGLSLQYSKSVKSDYSLTIINSKSVESDHPFIKIDSTRIESDYTIKRTDPQSLESDHPIRQTEIKSVQSDYPIKKTDPQSIESDHPVRQTETKSVHSDYSVKKPDPQSIESDYPIRKTATKSVQSDYSVKEADPHGIESDYSIGKTESKSIGSGVSVKHPDPQSIESDYPVKKPEPKSIESNHLAHSTQSVTFNNGLTSLHPQPTTSYFVPSSVSQSTSIQGQSSTVQLVPSASDAVELSRTHPKESSTPGYDIEMASVLAISSFFGVNSSRNTSSTFENSAISESDSKTEVRPTPSMDMTLFKDNHYWILTVLEAPSKEHLPENFSSIMESRLANAYSEAFRKSDGNGDVSRPENRVVVKILTLTNDLLLGQVSIVYVVEKGGNLVPASTASKYLNFLRYEQLREFLGLYAILNARPYQPSEPQPVPSSIPVVTIVCSILGILLFLFCCFCVYCRCCRPKKAGDSSPASSASGTLQRSLEKHGQHNRKHLFREMAHQLTAEIATQRKQDSSAPDIYAPEKEMPTGKSLPPLPPTDEADTINKAMKMLKILENKDASTSPIVRKSSPGTDRSADGNESTLESKQILTKPKRRRKVKEHQDKSSKEKNEDGITDDMRPLPPISKELERSSTPEAIKKSSYSDTSSRHPSSSLTSSSEKGNEEFGSDGSNAELLPPLQDLIAKSKADSEAAAADTQIHLSRVRQRISELLDDAFALAGGRKFYGSLRSKRIEPATGIFPRYASLRSQSAAECSLTGHEENSSCERRPISEGGQHLLGAITDDGQLITRPPPKLVWDQDTEDLASEANTQDVTEAHNRHINFFPFQQQPKLRQISASSTSSLPMLDTLHESHVDLTASTSSTNNVLREAASEVYLAHSSKIHPAVADQYDEIDVVSALREGEPVAALIQAIKDELQRFSGSLPGTNNESNA